MRKVLRGSLYILGGIFVLLLAAVIWLNTPYGKNYVRTKAEAYLRHKLKTEVYIGGLGYGLPKYIVLENVLFKDQAKDTLLAVGKLKIDLDMLKLIHKDIDVQEVLLEGVHAHIYRNTPDTNFNFTYIVKAFTGNDTTPAKQNKKSTDTTSGSLKIDLKRVAFDDIHLRFDDQTGGTKLIVNLEHLDLKMKKIDLDKMLFHIKDLSMTGLQTVFEQDTSYLTVKPATSSKKTQLQLIADNINLKQVAFQFNSTTNQLFFGIKLKKLDLKLKTFDLAQELVDIKSLSLDTTAVQLVMGKQSKQPPPTVATTTVPSSQTQDKGWRVNANEIKLAGINYRMDNNNQPRQLAGIDYAHLDVHNLSLNLENLLYSTDTISGNMQHLAVTEKSGLVVKELRTVFNYNNQGAVLKNLYALTPNTVLQNYIEVKYPSLEALKTRLQSMQLKVNITNSLIGFNDILIFEPSLAKQDLFKKNRNGHLKLEATAAGYLNALNIGHFYAGMHNTEVLLNGQLNGLPDANKIAYNLHVSKLISTRDDITSLMPLNSLNSIRLPDEFGASGQVSGTTKDYNTNLLMTSTDGIAYVKGNILMSPGKGKERYNLYVKTQQLNLGQILKKDTLMGKVSAEITAKGQSFDIKTMQATLNGSVQYAMLKEYGYHDIIFKGRLAAKQGKLSINSTDPNVHLSLTAEADLRGKYAAAKADIQMDSVDFKALNLYKTELRIHGKIHADFPELNPDYPKGSFVWQQPVIVANGHKYLPDSLYITSNPSEDTGQNIVMSLDVLHAVIRGKTPLTSIGDIIEDHIHRHNAFVKDMAKDTTKHNFMTRVANKKPDTAHSKIPADYNLTMYADITDRPILHGILPGLAYMDSIHADASLSPRDLSVNVTMPQLVYNTTTIQNGNINVTGTDSAFTYKVTVDQIRQGEFNLWYANIHGNLDGENITTNISIADSVKKQRFGLAASLKIIGDTQVIQLQPGLILNYLPWEVAQPNSINLTKEGLYVQNFGISNNGQYIKANSDVPKPNTPLKIDISNFMLANITDIISKDTTLVNGLLGGSITVEKFQPDIEVNGDLKIDGLSVMGDTVGNLAMQVNNKEANTINTQLTLKGYGNDIALTGNYYTEPNNGNDLDLALKLTALNMHTIDGISMGALKNSSGHLNGDLNIKGTASAPLITGQLHTDSVTTTVSMLNAYFKMPAETIKFSGQSIAFNNFSIFDSTGNKAQISGDVDTKDLGNIGMNLQIKAKHWRALHSTSKDNKNFYGDLLLSTDLDVKGTPSAPDIDGSLNILKGTNMTVVMPETDPQLESDKGIVKFINMHDTARYHVLAVKKKDTTKVKLAAGSNINVNIEVNKEAQFSMIIDQASGDFISVKGDASLNASISPGGAFGLTGDYELTGGAYQLNYNFIKRKFLIQKGSTITFAGDPVNAEMNVTATYEADVAPYDLIQKEITDPSQLNYYKQNLPFNVLLHLQGHIMQPSLTFDIQLPENKVYPISADQVELIQGKLNQVRADTSELNKQVFAVLILNRFVADDPFSSEGGGGVGFTALQSVSTFIGEQLNQFAKGLVKGVDISANLATSQDYTTGDMRQRTDFNLAASKTLFNDRLKLTVGNDFELEGPQTGNNQNSMVPSDLAADYLLSADGKYTMRVYRKNYDEGVLEGYVTETGLNFIINLNYNHFMDIFKNKKKEEDTEKSKDKDNK